MNIRKIVISTFILLSAIFADLKIGWIDSAVLMTSIDDMRQVQAELEKEQRRLESEYMDLANSLDSLSQDYGKQRLLMSDTRRAEKENEIVTLEKSVQKFQLDKFGPEGELYRTQNQLIKPILAKIDAAIQKVGSEQGYDFIMDAQTGALVYAIEAHNLTESVLNELARANDSGPNPSTGK